MATWRDQAGFDSTDGGTLPDGGTPSKPTQITFVGPAQTVTAGQCSAATVIEARDATGTAAPVANNTTLTVMGLLLATDDQAINGLLYNGNAARRNEANAVYSALNQAGSIS